MTQNPHGTSGGQNENDDTMSFGIRIELLQGLMI